MEISFKCPACGHALTAAPDLQGSTVACPGCQSTQTVPVFAMPMPPALPSQTAEPAAACNRQTYILVGVLTAVLLGGGFGIHNFIAGRTSTAIPQCILCAVGLVLIFCTFGLSYLLNLAVIVWAIIDVCTVTTDGQGRRMA